MQPSDCAENSPADESKPDEPVRYIAFLVAYDGTDWVGSQRQKNGRSVQGELERAIEKVTGVFAPVTLAGRTDAGVHAAGQCGKFTTNSRIPAEKMLLALNTHLDRSIRVWRSWETDERFHPRFTARSRAYRYSIDNAPIANPLTRRITGHIREALDVEAMQLAAGVFIGEHDFAAWQSAGSPNGPTVREVTKIEIGRIRAFGSELIEIEIEANAFLYQMVRNIVGALIEVGRGKLAACDLQRLMDGRDRTLCPPPAPPQGLCLEKVNY
jgi:tRNA pseudouridine38-40 synthase